MPTLYEDTRQQAGKHKTKNDWWERHGVTVVRKKLDFGDYVTDGSNISVDTKRSVMEVVMDCGRDHARFVREMERAAKAGYRLVILIETPQVKSIADLSDWTNDVCRRCERHRLGYCVPKVAAKCATHRSKPMQGVTLGRIMTTMQEEYNCVFEFVHPLRAARRICEILGVRYD